MEEVDSIVLVILQYCKDDMDGSERYHGLFFITIDCISVMGGSAHMENLRIRTLAIGNSNQNDTSTSLKIYSELLEKKMSCYVSCSSHDTGP
jgi:hypothetical protein